MTPEFNLSQAETLTLRMLILSLLTQSNTALSYQKGMPCNILIELIFIHKKMDESIVRPIRIDGSAVISFVPFIYEEATQLQFSFQIIGI